MPISAIQTDFTAGELAPSLMARVDFTKYAKGCRTVRNFLVHPHGGAVKRPGFALLDVLPGEARLVPFVFNEEDAYCLIFGEKWLRIAVHAGSVTFGGKPYQIESPYTLEQAKRLSVAQSADVLFIACQGVPPHKLMRYGHTDWRFEAMTFTPGITPPAWVAWSETHDSYEYTHAYYANELYERIEFDDTESFRYEYHEVPHELYTRKGSSSTTTGSGAVFVNAALDSEGKPSPPQLTTPYAYQVTSVTDKGKESALSVRAEITGPASSNWQAGDYIQLRWHAVAGADEYRVYKAAYGGRAGYIGTVKASAVQGDQLSFVDNNISPSLGEGAPEYVDPFPDEDYPGAVCLFEQRLVFASSPKRPQTIWMSKTGDYDNFATYTPVADDSPLELTLASTEVSAARWLVPLRSLILGTTGIEWELSAREGAFGPKTAKATPQSYWGSSLRRAMVVGNVVLHVNSAGTQVRNLQYDFAADSYGGADLSILAAHLLENARITDWTYQKNPDSIIWAVRSDGVLLGLTFQAEHQITAWHRHDTAGSFLSVCAIPKAGADSLFAVVYRGGKHLLERMAERDCPLTEAVFLDSALTYRGGTTTRIGGLDHLNGRTVRALADGKPQGPRLVAGGSISLDVPASVVTVGLPYEAELETMPVELVSQGGSSLALKKQINSVNVLLTNSMHLAVGVRPVTGTGGKLTWQDVRWQDNGTAEPFTGIRQITPGALAENSLTVCLRSVDPTPVTVLGLVARVTVNE